MIQVREDKVKQAMAAVGRGNQSPHTSTGLADASGTECAGWMPASHITAPASRPGCFASNPALYSVHPAKQQMTAQGRGSLPPKWEMDRDPWLQPGPALADSAIRKDDIPLPIRVSVSVTDPGRQVSRLKGLGSCHPSGTPGSPTLVTQLVLAAGE